MPSEFSIFITVLYEQIQRIVEYFRCFPEADAVLTLVGGVFGFIPLQLDGGHDFTVITLTQLCEQEF